MRRVVLAVAEVVGHATARRLATSVVLRRATAEDGTQRPAVADEQTADVVGLEEPLVGVDGHRVGAVEVRDAIPVPHRQPCATAVCRIDVQPQALGLGHVGQLADGVDRTRVGRAGDSRDGVWRQTGRSVAGHGIGDRGPTQVEVVVGWEHDQRLGREPELVERPRDREMRLVAGVDPGALEILAARRPWQVPDAAETQVARQRHPHEIGHHAAAGEEPEAVRPVAHHVAQPAHDLFLGERREGTGMPHVDALVGHLREQLAHDRHRERRRREVPELARVLGVHQAARQAGGELFDDVGRAHGRRRGRARTVARSGWIGCVIPSAGFGVRRWIAHRALGRDAVQEFQRLVPRPLPERCERRPRRCLVAVADQLRLRVPVEAVEVRVDVHRCSRGLERRSVGHPGWMVPTTLRAMSDEIDPTSHDPEGRERLVAALDALGVDYELFPCDPALADTAAFCAAYGFEPEDSANTIVVIGKGDPPRYAACVVLAPNRLDVNRTVRDRLGTRKASFAPAETTRDITGMEIGGVTVFGLPAGLPIWVDGRVMRRERIILGGGSRSWKVLAAPSILSALQRVEVVESLATDPPTA